MPKLMRLFTLILAFVPLGCGSTGFNSGPGKGPQAGTPPAGTAPPSFSRVFIVVEENASYSQVIGNPVMPFLNSLATQFGLATNYFANTHPSIGNYFMLTTGQIVTNDDAFSGTVSVDNVVRDLVAAGKTWRAYAESLPSAGYTGGDVYPYLKRHNPFAYFSDVIGDSAQAANMVPFSQFAIDLANGSLPQYVFIVPNAEDDAHDCAAGGSCTEDVKLAAADSWLRTNISPLLTASAFQNGGLLLVTFDEGDPADTRQGGGQIATVVASPKAKKGFQSNTFYQHESLLKLSLRALGLNSFPGAAANATDMGEFF
jgi:phosphatidylinositol-3-phosphatase